MRRLLSCILAAVVYSGSHAAVEAWCTSNSANCVCADNFQSTSYSMVGTTYTHGAVWQGAQTTEKPCFYERQGSFQTRYCPGGDVFANTVRIVPVSGGSPTSAETAAINALPPGHSVQRFLRPTGDFFSNTHGDQCSTYGTGHDRIDLSGGIKRLAIRWYVYYSPDYITKSENAACGNSKFGEVCNGTEFANPCMVNQWHDSGTNVYNFVTSQWDWPTSGGLGSQAYDGFLTGRAPPGTAPFTNLVRGKWLRFEIIVRRPAPAEYLTAGFDYELWITDVTLGTAPYMEVQLSAGCPDCVNIDRDGNGGGSPYGNVADEFYQPFVWTTSVRPTDTSVTINSLAFQSYRDTNPVPSGECTGWWGWMYLAVAKWTTDAGQMIGAASEVEGTGQTCGNNTIEGTEVCDGTDLASETCASQGLSSGTLACNGGCTAFDTSACVGAIRGVVIRGGTVK